MVSSYIGSEFEVFLRFCDIVISKSINVSHNTLTYPSVGIYFLDNKMPEYNCNYPTKEYEA